MGKPAIFLDRDGVLNQAILKNGKPYPPASIAELKISQEVLPTLNKLKSLGYLLIVATNQPDVARGTTARSTVEQINQILLNQLPLDDIRVCYHDDKDACSCRKPLPGLLLQAANEHDINLQQSVMIGDRAKDIAAGLKAGCKTVWIDYGYQEPAPEQPDFIAKSLPEAAEWITGLSMWIKR